MIVITETQHRVSTEFCGEMNLDGNDDDDGSNMLASLFSFQPLAPSHRQASTEHCYSSRLRDPKLESACNGLHSCLHTVGYESHRAGKTSSCSFKSNMKNVFYKCLPSRKNAHKIKFS
jgi:hypothetical protein